MVSLGATQQLDDHFQLAFDGSLSNLGSAPASGGVEASPGTGWEFALYPQLVASGLLLDNDVGTLGVRWFHGSSGYLFADRDRTTPGDARAALDPRLHDYRTQSARDEFVPRSDDPNATLPAVVSATRVRNGQPPCGPYSALSTGSARHLDTDCGVEWTTGRSTARIRTATILTFGVRYDF
jgi:hypothetical protein